MIQIRRKLIEVALPLEKINRASAREKSIRHGHPSTLHLWWARRPLAAARAVIFAQMVDDPSEYVDTLLADPALNRAAQRELVKQEGLWAARKAAHDTDPTLPPPGEAPTLAGCAADLERERLFELIDELVQWENSTNETVLERARAEIWQSWRRACAANADHPQARQLFDRHRLPGFHDPFAGGGALPLEAQRLGLEAHASDLNPVAVLINKAMIEIPPKFANQPPVHPATRDSRHLRSWKGAEGLAEDVRHYSRWMRDEAERRIGHLYPKVEITAEMARDRPDLLPMVGRELTVIAWLWARTVKSPNPAFREIDVPLASTFVLATKPGKEAHVEPVVENGHYYFTIRVGRPDEMDAAKDGTKLGRGSNFRCVMSGSPISGDYIKDEGQAGRMGARLMAIVAEGEYGRTYLPPLPEHEEIAKQTTPGWRPVGDVPSRLTGGTCVPYGLREWGDLFTNRQLVALGTLAELTSEVRRLARQQILEINNNYTSSENIAEAYANSIVTYLSIMVDKLTESHSTICTWSSATKNELVVSTFRRHAIPMTWDFAEANPFAESSGSINKTREAIAKVLTTSIPIASAGFATQENASTQEATTTNIVSTDPPYYNNIGYADLSDYFYVWLRKSLFNIYPDIFSTRAVPKDEELVATPYRHGGRDKAEAFFLKGMTQAMHRLAEQAHPGFPVTIYYAFKQSETTGDAGTASTGWETFLDAVIEAGFAISGTWPIRTERDSRSIGIGTNALASSIVLVCRRRPDDAPTATRRAFLAALKQELPQAVTHLQHGNIAPVDLAQSAIGPGMAVFTRYGRVVDAEGRTVSVREALALINGVLDEVMAEQEGDFDAETRWALAWFEHVGFNDGAFGEAETLSKAKNTSLTGLAEAGILVTRGGKVRLFRPAELPADWTPAEDSRLTVWEMVHHLIRVLEAEGERAAGRLVAALGSQAEVARELAYRLYALCERKKRAPEAMAYNGLVQSWPEIIRQARDAEGVSPAAAAGPERLL